MLYLPVTIVGVQEKMGIMNKGVIYALWDYEPQNDDELPMREGDCMTIIRREDEDEIEWWWARLNDREGYVPRNLLGVSPAVTQPVSTGAREQLCRNCSCQRHSTMCCPLLRGP